MEMDEEEQEAPSLSPDQLLHLADSHLRVRNFSLSRQYALEALEPAADSSVARISRRTYLHASQIVAISDVLSASSEPAPNSYSVLGVDTFCSDLNRIRDQFKSLLLQLSSLSGKSQLADQAILAARDSWNVLANPMKKRELDDRLKADIARCSGGGGVDCQAEAEEEETFWTFCPYCYYMYEYAKVYEGCCLRCQNEQCRKAFEGVRSRNTPPAAALKNGESFSCFGFFPLALNGNNGGKEDVKFSPWSPFVGMMPYSEGGEVGKNDNFDDVVEISLSSNESKESEAPVHSGAQQAQYVATDERGGFAKEDNNNNNVNLNEASTSQYVHADEWNAFDFSQDTMGGYDEYGPDVDVGFFEKDGEIFVQLSPGPNDPTF